MFHATEQDRLLLGLGQTRSGFGCRGTQIRISIADTTDPNAASFKAKIKGLALPTRGLAAAGDVVVCATGTALTVHRQSKEYAVLSTIDGLDYSPLAVAVNKDGSEVAVSAQEERGKPKKVTVVHLRKAVDWGQASKTG